MIAPGAPMYATSATGEGGRAAWGDSGAANGAATGCNTAWGDA